MSLIQKPPLKTSGHHWWPRSLSKFWKASDGKVGRINASGDIVRAPPAQFGSIKNGHDIRLSRVPGEVTAWDERFEAQFDKADGNFSRVLKWLESLSRESLLGQPLAERFIPQAFPSNLQNLLVECLASLAVRNPMNREACVGLAEKLRGPITEPERSALIAANMKHSLEIITRSMGDRGKFVVVFSPMKDLIFGDGFFHNLLAITNPPYNPQILAPLTPEIGVLYVLPTSYRKEPQLTTLMINEEEADTLNHTVQIYAAKEIFFRQEVPILSDDFAVNKHLQYAAPETPITRLIDAIPGVTPRDSSLDNFFRSVGI